MADQQRPTLLLRQSNIKTRDFDTFYDFFIKDSGALVVNPQDWLFITEQSPRNRQVIIRYVINTFAPNVINVVDILRDIGLNNVALQALVPMYHNNNNSNRFVTIYNQQVTYDATRVLIENLWGNDPLENVIVFLRTSNTLNTPTTLEASRSETYRDQANYRIAALSSFNRESLKLISFDFNVAPGLDMNYSLVNIYASVYSHTMRETVQFAISIQMGELATITSRIKESGDIVMVPETRQRSIAGTSAIGRIRLATFSSTTSANQVAAAATTTTVATRRVFIPAANTRIRLVLNPSPL